MKDRMFTLFTEPYSETGKGRQWHYSSCETSYYKRILWNADLSLLLQKKLSNFLMKIVSNIEYVYEKS